MESLCAYWRFNDVQAGKAFDSSGRNNVGSLASDANVSPRPLHANSPISDEDEWGEKVALGHSVIGEVSSEELVFPDGSKGVTAELQVRRISPVEKDSEVSILSLNGRLSLLLDDQSELVVDADGARLSTGKRLVIKEWTHLAVLSSELNVSLFINGLPVHTQVLQTPLVSGPSSISVGAKVVEITEVRVWSIARTEVELKQYMTTALPRPAGNSKWKGLRINLQADASSRPWSKQIPQGASVPVNQTRRVFEEKSSLGSSRRELNDNIRLTRNLNPDIHNQPETIQSDIQNQLKGHNEAVKVDGEGQMEKLVVEKKPEQIPVDKQPNNAQISNSGNIENIQVSGSENVVNQEVGKFEVVKAPIVKADQSIDINVKGPPRNAQPILVPVQLQEAVKLFDSLLETAVLDRGFNFDKSELEAILQAISGYVRSQYRLGPYLAPMPHEEVLARLRVVATYIGLSKVLSLDTPWGSLPALRLPLLSQHIRPMLFRCIEEARRRNDQGSLSALARILVKECGSSLSMDEIESVRGYLSVSHQRIDICCPFCDTKLRDPIQPACVDGCGTTLAVCYHSGRIVPADDCAKCRLCATTLSVKALTFGRAHGNVPTNINMELPKACFMCGCMGSMVPLM